MKKLLLIFLVLGSSLSFVKAQNLVPNPSFEQYDSCPNNNDCNIGDATGWSCYGGCVVYCNSCAPNSLNNYNGVPYNAAGFQYAATGNAYAGEYFYYPNSGYGRGYMGTTLSTPLIKRHKVLCNF